MFTKRRSSPSSVMRPRSSSCSVKRPSSADRTVSPSTVTSAAPPATSRSWVGSLIRVMGLDQGLFFDVGDEVLHGRIDLEGLERAADGIKGLEAVAGDDDDGALVVADGTLVGELLEDGRGDATSGLGEDAGGLG